MADELEMIDSPETCEETTEYDNRIEDEVEIEPEEEQDDFDTSRNREEIEQQFARYERNYRARRIREMMLTPFKKKGRSHKTTGAAA